MKSLYVKTFLFAVLCAVKSLYCAENEGNVILSEELGFQITFPENWKVYKNSNKNAEVEGIRHLSENSPDLGFVDVKISNSAKNKVLKDVVDKMYDHPQKPPENYEVVESTEMKIGEVNGFKIKFRFDNEGARYQHVDYIFFVEDRCFILKCGAKNQNYQVYSEDMEKIVKSFKLLRVPKKDLPTMEK